MLRLPCISASRAHRTWRDNTRRYRTPSAQYISVSVCINRCSRKKRKLARGRRERGGRTDVKKRIESSAMAKRYISDAIVIGEHRAAFSIPRVCRTPARENLRGRRKSFFHVSNYATRYYIRFRARDTRVRVNKFRETFLESVRKDYGKGTHTWLMQTCATWVIIKRITRTTMYNDRRAIFYIFRRFNKRYCRVSAHVPSVLIITRMPPLFPRCPIITRHEPLSKKSELTRRHELSRALI